MTAAGALIGQSLIQQWTSADMATFNSELTTKTNKTFQVINAAEGGAGLLPNSVTTAGHYWTNFTDPATSPLLKFTAQLAGLDLQWLLINVGQQDAFVGCTPKQWLNGLMQMYSFICTQAGKSVGDVPMLVSPLGNLPAAWASQRNVLAAQYQVERIPGLILGPETWDYPVQADGVHLTSYSAYATRAADAISQIIGSSTPPPPPPSGGTGQQQGSTPGGAATTGFAGATWFDRAYTLTNGVNVYKGGFYSPGAASATLKIAVRSAAGQYDVVVTQVVSHPGGGWQDFSLTTPFLIPASGEYHLGAYIASGTLNYNTQSYAAKNGDVTGAGFAEATSLMFATRVTY